MKHSDMRWRKSSHSGEQGNCVEVGATWSTSSHGAGNGGQCVELRADEAVVLARDSKDPDGPVLGLGVDAWHAFLTTVKTGRLDLSSATAKLR
ncbi:DUF397 domain-containing protein [Actinomadura latina]|uniref:DUF397 domain-containing protein n=1 Tax=Actinomadura latina TaxID=163603 RepID=A0A846Z8E4_9ACTN|nr:DUF397 domain-containing protein [Actinomadura latina]NKZ07034.1 DUF397 domain-containing protein [Actinomadura latina]